MGGKTFLVAGKARDARVSGRLTKDRGGRIEQLHITQKENLLNYVWLQIPCCLNIRHESFAE